MKAFLLILLCLAPAGTPWANAADLASAAAEPDLEKRSEKALAVAGDEFKAAKKASREGMPEAEAAALMGIRKAVELGMKSLADSGKDARRNPKYFKRAEIALRKLMRDLEDFRIMKSVDERQPAEELIAYIHEAHDQVLLGIMTKKK